MRRKKVDDQYAERSTFVLAPKEKRVQGKTRKSDEETRKEKEKKERKTCVCIYMIESSHASCYPWIAKEKEKRQ